MLQMLAADVNVSHFWMTVLCLMLHVGGFCYNQYASSKLSAQKHTHTHTPQFYSNHLLNTYTTQILSHILKVMNAATRQLFISIRTTSKGELCHWTCCKCHSFHHLGSNKRKVKDAELFCKKCHHGVCGACYRNSPEFQLLFCMISSV